MWPRLRIETRLSKETAAQRLAALLERRRSPDGDDDADDVVRRQWRRSKYDAPFTGWVEGDEFQLRRVTRYSNSYRPIVFGQIGATTRGSVVKAVMRPPIPVVVFMCVWFGLATLMCAVLVYQGLAAWDWKGVAGGVGSLMALMALAAAVAALSFIPEKQKTIRLMKIALSHRRKNQV